MKILFNKYEGTGNDFIIIENTPAVIDHSDSLLISRLCDRRFGIGADGLILIEKHEGYDFEMVYFNSDGFFGRMCGNGGRCAAYYVMKHLEGKHTLNFYAGDGAHSAHLNGDLIDLSINDVHDIRKTSDGFVVNTGVPHLVVFVDDVDNADLVTVARPLRYSPLYAPEGVNVNLVQVEGDKLKVRTYERGVEDETLSCGTGVTASAIAAAISGKIITDHPEIKVKGGTLFVTFKINNETVTEIHLRGPATFVFSGETEI
ncbi:MAG TPA: diaminopimelate epimerase [Bacteroidales bacterium]|nr:diaminopimelate epimerase [Bacteroidales bacterium]